MRPSVHAALVLLAAVLLPACDPAGPGSTDKPDDSGRPAHTAEPDDTGDTAASDLRYADADGDGYGDPATGTEDSGFEGVDNGEDCNDADAAVHPGAEETCDGHDNNCDGDTDGADADGAVTWYRDADWDDYGTDTDTMQACEPALGYVADAGDCDDGDRNVSPDANET